MNRKLLLALLVGFSSISSMAFPKAPFDALKSDIEPPLKLAPSQYNFEGIVKLSNCSGSIIRFEGQSLDDKAIVLTNGHCLGGRFLKPGQVVHDKRTRRRMKVADSKMRFRRINATRVMYATMTDTDAALYRLKETYNDLIEKYSIRPYLLSSKRPDEGTSIEVISGYWERGYACRIDQFVPILKEGNWIFTDSIRYTNPGCEIIGGTSGSPVIESGTRVVIGVNNTANESGRECTRNNPCEVEEDGSIRVIKGGSYGQQTYQFYSCLDEKFNIDLDKEGCALPKP